MANILCIWELGGATGHLANLAPWVEEAIRRGHRVTLATPHPERCARQFAGLDIEYVTAPRPLLQRESPKSQMLSWTQVVLHALGPADELATRIEHWQRLFSQLEPDLVVYEYAPTALIASLQHGWQKWITGNGFTLPRADLPYFGLFPRIRNTQDNARSLAQAESQLLELVNAVQPIVLERPEALFSLADELLLMTLPAMDPFGERGTPPYLGIGTAGVGAAPQWPEGDGAKVFGYLQPFPGLQFLLEHLDRRGVRMLVYCPALPAAIRTAFPRIAFAEGPVDLEQAFEQARLVVTMGNHTTTAQAVLAGTPLLLLPNGLEQFYTARRIVNAGVGVGARADGLTPEAIDAALSMAERGRIVTNSSQRRALGGRKLASKVTQLFDELPQRLSLR